MKGLTLMQDNKILMHVSIDSSPCPDVHRFQIFLHHHVSVSDDSVDEGEGLGFWLGIPPAFLMCIIGP
jgi:hypothetical protein